MFQELPNIVVPHCTCCYNRYGELTPLAADQPMFEKLLKEGKSIEEALDEMGHYRMCCRNRFLQTAHFYLRTTPELYRAEGKTVFEEPHIPRPVPQRTLEFPSQS